MTLKSPGIDVCELGARTRCCSRCGRTAQEITSWRKMTPYRQRVALHELGRPLARLRAELHPSGSTIVVFENGRSIADGRVAGNASSRLS